MTSPQAPQPDERSSSRQSDRIELIMRRLRMGQLGWSVSISLSLAAWALDLLDMGWVEILLFIALIVVAQLFFRWAVSSGWSQRFCDPSLTLPHILLAVFIGLWVIAHAGEARTILLVLFILASMFGSLQLKQREFMLVAVVTVFGYTVITVRDLVVNAGSRSSEVVILELIGFSALMVWLAWFGAHIAELRRTLSGRNRELRTLSERLRHQAEHDELTGLPNRRRLLTQLDEIAATDPSGDQPLSIAILDLDHFKQVNDEHGHQVGDEVLAALAERARDLLRGADNLHRVDETMADIGRFGGEEFLVVLLGTDAAGARLAAERLRAGVAEQPFETGAGPIACTLSIGVAGHRPGEPIHRTIARADEALYRAKDRGRDTVESE